MSEIMTGEGFTDCQDNFNEKKTAFLIIPHYLFQSNIGRSLYIMKDKDIRVFLNISQKIKGNK